MEVFGLAFMGFLGIVLHVMVKHKDIFIKKGATIPWRVIIFNTVFSLIIVSILIYLREDFKGFYPITKFNMLITGYAADSVWRHVTAKALARMGVK